jgi:hypothetical protein
VLKLEIGHETVVEEGHKVRFVFSVEYVLELEHSLAALSKWESIWEKPFIDDKPKTPEEILSYIECMMIRNDHPDDVLSKLTQSNFDTVDKYINAKMTATWFNEKKNQVKKSSEKITAELIYYWMSGIPSPPPGYEHWHLNKLFTYIKIHDVKNNTKPKRMSKGELAAQRRELNARRRAETGSRG